MIYCPYCGTPQEDSTRFCANCGGNLAASASGGTAPQYQAPQYQQPQYQAPQYQQPQYQQPQYQAPQYQQHYGGYNPAANRAAAKKPAATAMVLCIIALILQIAALIVSDAYYKYVGVTIAMNLTSYITAVIRCGICAIFPFLVKRAASSSDPRSGKGLHTGTVCFLCVQVVGVIACFAGWLPMRFGAPGMIYSAITAIFAYVAGSNLFSSLVSLFHASRFFLVSSIFHTCSALCYWIGSILTLNAAAKLKKS